MQWIILILAAKYVDSALKLSLAPYERIMLFQAVVNAGHKVTHAHLLWVKSHRLLKTVSPIIHVTVVIEWKVVARSNLNIARRTIFKNRHNTFIGQVTALDGELTCKFLDFPYQRAQEVTYLAGKSVQHIGS